MNLIIVLMVCKSVELAVKEWTYLLLQLVLILQAYTPKLELMIIPTFLSVHELPIFEKIYRLGFLLSQIAQVSLTESDAI